MTSSYTNRDAYDIGVRLAQANPGVDYDDLDPDAPQNQESIELVRYIDAEERDGLAVYLENGFLDQREGKVH